MKNLSGQGYKTVIIPSVTAISKKAMDRLQAFAKAGGCVVFLGEGPSLVVDKTFLKAGQPVDLSWAIREPSGELTDRVFKAMPKPDVILDQSCPSVKVQHRRWRDADLYFFFNEGTEQQSRNAVLTGSGQAHLWDAASGRIESLAGSSSEKGAVHMPLVLGPHGTRFIVIGPRSSGGL